MSTTQPQRIVCPACGRSGPYRPELAGKRLKCKCGGTIQVPAASGPEDQSEEPLRPEPIAPAPEGRNPIRPMIRMRVTTSGSRMNRKNARCNGLRMC